MGNVRRIYVEKKSAYAVSAHELMHELKSYLGITDVSSVRVLNRYDIDNISDEVYKESLSTVFSEPPVDTVYEESFDADGRVFSVEPLPGQFDQRADSAVQCVKLINKDADPVIRTAITYVISGDISDDEFNAIKKHCINPVDSRESDGMKPESLEDEYEEPADVEVMDGFKDMKGNDLKDLYDSLNLAMTFRDFIHIQNYFRDSEHRDPTITEIRVLDTYWSDHCRHTTFNTELKNVKFDDGFYRKPIEDAFLDYKDNFKVIYKDRDDKYVCLMDLALMAMKTLKKNGYLTDQEESDEINACSIVVPVQIDDETEEWLINFKNETHNHPTEIEPFGGAATCLGGAIRDPLSGRTYVYQAMRVTGAADPTGSVKDTIEGKLPQKKLVREAAHGYSSYGNQVGLATGYVKEIYHPDYVAKRMEIGAVMGAAPRKAVKRLTSDPGDIIILLGGRTGRDGIGGATGSSKAHTTMSTKVCGAEVQKGNPPTERKIQRLFRRPEVSSIIKKCNDFGAGGVSVAIGELADGLDIDLDKVPKKYAGLDGTELAISESQERMAVVVSPSDEEKFLRFAAEENLEAVSVASVTDTGRMVINWRGKKIVDLSRSFIDTNGAHQETDVEVNMPDPEKNFFRKPVISKVSEDLDGNDVANALSDTLSDINVCSQRGLVEMFDSSIGAGTVLMPYGGKTQRTEIQTMVAKLPVMEGKCDVVTMMAYGFDPYLSTWSPFHGAQYAVLSSVSKIVAAGGDFRKIHFTFQEYFRRMTEEPSRWSQPFAALLGAYKAQMNFRLASIGGKDSSSGTFNELDVPPTLVSFAVDVADSHDIISPEFKKAGDKIYKIRIHHNEYDEPDYENAMKVYDYVAECIRNKSVISAYVIDSYGAAPAALKMAFGNMFGVKIYDTVSPKDMFAPEIGSFIVEADSVLDGADGVDISLIGEVCDDGKFSFGKAVLSMDECLKTWSAPLEKVFPTRTDDDRSPVTIPEYNAPSVSYAGEKFGKPRVFIPVFPGTNCEYDSAKAFERAGAVPTVKVFRNRDAEDIRASVEEFAREIDNSQIIMFPGGFSAGDEPEGSAKFFANAFRNDILKEAVGRLIDTRDGLMLGICNGFQALIKLGLVPYGKIRTQSADSPTLTYNTIGRHISHEVSLKVVSNKSPWLRLAKLGGVYVNPASHGEGRFVASDEWLKKLIENGQVATQYVDIEGNATLDEEWDINGSYMAIEGITSPDGRIFGKMTHAERIGDHVAMNIYGEQDMKIFESGVSYFE